MPIPDFFPPFASTVWTFEEKTVAAGKLLDVRVDSEQTAEGRLLKLSYPTTGFQAPQCFFDQLLINEHGLAITSVNFSGQILRPRPPLVLTLDNQVNSSADFWPGIGDMSPAVPPYRCFTTYKSVSADGQRWTLHLSAEGGRPPVEVFNVDNLEFMVGRGLTRYVGVRYGVSFFYERLD